VSRRINEVEKSQQLSRSSDDFAINEGRVGAYMREENNEEGSRRSDEKGN
jgi:hypothetical protein